MTGPRETRGPNHTQLASDSAVRGQLDLRFVYAYARAMSRHYAELHCASAFSFLEGASLPEDLVARAAELGLETVALIDRNTVSGAPRFWKAARDAGIRPLVGAEVVLDERPEHEIEAATAQAERPPTLPGPLGLVPDPPPPGTPLPRLTLLAEDRRGYRNLCRLLTAATRGRPKGAARASWRQVEAHAEGLHCLTGGGEGVLAQRLAHRGLDAARRELERLRSIFPGRLHVELQRHHLRQEEHRNRALASLAERLRLPLVACGGVRYANRRDKELADVLACIREGVTLDAAGGLLDAQRERHLRSAREMALLFADRPRAVAAAAELAGRLSFTLSDLGYRFPDFPLPPGETPISYLRHVTWNGARARFRPLTARAQAQLERELDLIEKLDLAGYFLIVWDIVRFCQREKILAQGRGSAANSAVCYALSITAVDPVKMELLFERFLSEERGEWPDIDLDLPSGDQREKVIQHVYERYGPHGAGDDRQRHHLPRPLGGARGRQGARLLARAGRPAVQAARPSRLGRDPRGRPHPRPGARHGRARPGRAAGAALRAAVVADPQPAPPPRPALRRHGHRPRPARRGGAARARGHAGPHRHPVGQGRLRRPRHHQDRPARPRHAGRARGGDPA